MPNLVSGQFPKLIGIALFLLFRETVGQAEAADFFGRSGDIPQLQPAVIRAGQDDLAARRNDGQVLQAPLPAGTQRAFVRAGAPVEIAQLFAMVEENALAVRAD